MVTSGVRKGTGNCGKDGRGDILPSSASRGRVPSIGVLETAVAALGPSSRQYSEKQKRSKLRSDLVFTRVLTFLAPSKEGQVELMERCASRQGIKLVAEHDTQTRTTMTRLSAAYQQALTPHERSFILQFVNHVSLEELKGLGFNDVTKPALARSRRNGAILFQRTKPQQRVKKHSPRQHNRMATITALCQESSVPAWTSGAVRHCSPDDMRRTLTSPIWSLAKQAEAKGICAASTFAANIPGHFVKPTRKTDICRYCDDVRLKSKQPVVLQELRHHQRCAARQEEAFRKNIQQASSAASSMLVIRVDYKGGTVIGHSALERDDVVYGLGLIRICGFVVWFYSPGLPMPVYIDAVSDVLDSDSSVSCMALKLAIEKLLSHQKTRAAVQAASTVMIWCDCGQHFRSQVFVYSALWEVLAWLRKVKQVTVNFFAEKHGKGECDQHFSVIERYKGQYEQHMSRIKNVPDFITAQKAILEAKNSLRRLANDPELLWLFIPYTAQDIPVTPRKTARIPQIQSTYCISRERSQPLEEAWNLIFSDIWDTKKESQRIEVVFSLKGRRKEVRTSSGVKSCQDSNTPRLKRKRLLQERLLGGVRLTPRSRASPDSSDEAGDGESASSSD
jgi:hypothetical protein